MAEWFRSFFGGLYGTVLPATFSPQRSAQQARLIRRLLRLRKGGSVLDVPCGQGRIALGLAQAGLSVTGIDITPSFIRKARAGARAAGVEARFSVGDIRELDYSGEFDAVVNWFTSFGYFSDAVNLDVCRRMLRALRPGGRLLIETVNKTYLKSHFRSGSDETIGGVRIVHEHRRIDRTSRINDTWTMSRGRRKERHRISVRIYSGAELRALLRAAGFESVRLYGQPPVGRLTRNSRRLIAVATAPK